MSGNVVSTSGGPAAIQPSALTLWCSVRLSGREVAQLAELIGAAKPVTKDDAHRWLNRLVHETLGGAK